MPVKKSKKLAISGKQLKALQKRIKKKRLAEDDYDLLLGLTETVECLSQALAEKETSIGRLCKYLLGAPTETAENVLKKKRCEPEEKSPKKPSKNHGRNPASAYPGAKRTTIEHPVLQSGQCCPDCEKGKIYQLALPSVFVHITGNAPLDATVYERTRLRCNLCGQIYTPELPDDVDEKKYDESAAAILALLKYGCGMPLHRLEKLQDNLGCPLPSSTQWDILNATAVAVAPVYDALFYQAAQGQLVHNDDTVMKVLSLLNGKESQNGRKGVFTTGIVSQCQQRQIALFMTGDQHAGENLTDLLKKRAAGLAPPIQMCDALSRNASKQFETIMANCIAHARRNFVELVDRFPDDCTFVIEKLGTVYHNDELTKQQNMSDDQRLDYHKQHSASVMDDLKRWCNRQIDEAIAEPNSGLGKAIQYMLNHWKKLTRFLHVPGAPLDNNVCERALKRAILHRKNALFYKTRRGAQVGDMFMSLIHTCQMVGVNPLDYLTWLLKNVPDLAKRPDDFLPWHYP